MQFDDISSTTHIHMSMNIKYTQRTQYMVYIYDEKYCLVLATFCCLFSCLVNLKRTKNTDCDMHTFNFVNII